MERALDYLAERGRKRVALVSSSHMTSAPEKMRQWTEGIRARGMITQPHWQQGLDIENPQSARNLVHLLMHDGQHQRPDGLLIGDDNLVEHATAGLIDAGVNVPGDVEVVAHCNFPWPTPSVLPVKRLGYDVRECLRTCVTLIDRQRKSQPVPAAVTVPARFEEDVVANGWAEDGGDGIKD
jgi:DNA-binding LacI/PurR family transcriptional regulator